MATPLFKLFDYRRLCSQAAAGPPHTVTSPLSYAKEKKEIPAFLTPVKKSSLLLGETGMKRGILQADSVNPHKFAFLAQNVLTFAEYADII